MVFSYMVNICFLVILNNLYTLRVSMCYMGTHYIVHTGVHDVHAQPPPYKKQKLYSTEKRKVINYTRSTSVNVLSSNLEQVDVRGYVMKRQQT